MTTALIADDERLMRESLARKLKQVWPDLQIIAEAENGEKALQLIEELAPEVVFLDIRMPGATGLEVAAQLSHPCLTVFITAYDQHAIEAFERGAIDYLLKPVEVDRLEITVARLRERLAIKPLVLPPLDQVLQELANRLPEQLLQNLQQRSVGETSPQLADQERKNLRWIKAAVGQSIRLIPINEVIYFQSDTKYTRVVTADGEALIRTPLKELLVGLDTDKFWQIHRGTVVNTMEITGANRDLGGRLLITLKSRPEKLEVSRTYADLFKHM